MLQSIFKSALLVSQILLGCILYSCSSGEIEAVKDGYLSEDKSISIGQLYDSVLTKETVKWVNINPDKKSEVTVTGDLAQGDFKAAVLSSCTVSAKLQRDGEIESKTKDVGYCFKFLFETVMDNHLCDFNTMMSEKTKDSKVDTTKMLPEWQDLRKKAKDFVAARNNGNTIKINAISSFNIKHDMIRIESSGVLVTIDNYLSESEFKGMRCSIFIKSKMWHALFSNPKIELNALSDMLLKENDLVQIINLTTIN